MRPPIAALLALLTAIAGCADDGGDTGTGGTPAPTGGNPGIAPQPDEVSVEVAAVGFYPATPAFEPTSIQVPAGALVHVTFRNEDLNPLVPHNWVVEGIEGAASDTIGAGEATSFDFTAPLAAGEHAFYCAIQGHRDAGMEGTLSVTIA